MVAGARAKNQGFSLVELVVSLAVLLILTAVAVPTLMRAYHAYQLSDSSNRVSGIMKLTRFEAIRKNTTIACKVQKSGSNWILWIDSNGNNVPDAGETQVVVTGTVTLLATSPVPATSMVTALGSKSPGLTTLSGGNASVTYDGRGAVFFGANPPAVYVFYLGNTAISDMGERAVVLLPSGIVQVWTADTASTWQRIS